MKFTCPCCGYKTFDEPLGSDEICQICFWQDDFVDLMYWYQPNGPNKVSLLEGQKNFQQFGSSEQRNIPHVRNPNVNDEKDNTWRVLDVRRDLKANFQKCQQDGFYPENSLDLYYWQDSYWLNEHPEYVTR